MFSLIAASSPINFTISHQPFSYLSHQTNFLPLVLVMSPPKRQQFLQFKRKQAKFNKKNKLFFEFSDCCCGVVRMCKRWEVDGDTALELEVLEFMKNSKTPEMFPSKMELIGAGRGDLAEAIVKRGGWMSMGWQDDEREREETEDGFGRDLELALESYGENGGESEGRSGSQIDEFRDPEGFSFSGNPSSSASSSGRSIEMEAEDDSGVEGILNRLARQRNLSFGLSLGKNGHVSENLGQDEQSAGMSKDVDSCRPEKRKPAVLDHNGPAFRSNGSYSNGSTSSPKAETWRTWSIRRAGYIDRDFEAAEIDFARNSNRSAVDRSVGEIITVTKDMKEDLGKKKEMNSCVEEIAQNDVKTRLQHLELELSSALCSLRSKSAGLSVEAMEHISEDLRQLSDASEFQENEVMNAQDNLRSIRAKLAVLEGKMALAINDAQKILDEKQKRIDDARRALQLLRTTCIIWPNSGTEVLLAGSFDGWATQRRMEKSSAGIFSLCLKLNPGKYEIKFIVDGSWKVDPLRPIVNYNGFENNLLIIT